MKQFNEIKIAYEYEIKWNDEERKWKEISYEGNKAKRKRRKWKQRIYVGTEMKW